MAEEGKTQDQLGCESLVHVLLVTFPGQGHINPFLRFAKILASNGLLITFSTVKNIAKQIANANRINGDGEPTKIGDGFIRFEFFEDGLEEGDASKMHELDAYLKLLEVVGRRDIARLIDRNAERKRPVSCVVSNPFLPWVSDVAYELGIPNAVLWVQSCASFSVYYHYQFGLVKFPTETEPEIDLPVPALPLLKFDEIPSFLHPSTPPKLSILKVPILGQIRNLEKAFCVLIDTFDELERETIDYMSEFCPIKTVGPLFKNAISEGASVNANMFVAANDCIEWLDSQPPNSVVYVSFGSLVSLEQTQLEELAHGLLSSGLAFLWVQRPHTAGLDAERGILPRVLTESEKGKVVEWAPQESVLGHPAVACFLTHCGWNSSMEAIASGVPVVAFPGWGDQVTNAVSLVDCFKIGVRLSRGMAEKRVVLRAEVEKCLVEATVGPKAEEIKINAMKWKAAAAAATEDGGSSHRNIQDFVSMLKGNLITKIQVGP